MKKTVPGTVPVFAALVSTAIALAAVFAATSAFAQAPQTVHLRGTIETVDRQHRDGEIRQGR